MIKFCKFKSINFNNSPIQTKCSRISFQNDSGIFYRNKFEKTNVTSGFIFYFCKSCTHLSNGQKDTIIDLLKPCCQSYAYNNNENIYASPAEGHCDIHPLIAITKRKRIN
jgi:hypothetical protein